MPELPEVETIRKIIGPQIEGLTIADVSVRRSEVIGHPSADEFCSQITGQTISGMERRGKYLLIILNNGGRIILHLRMTGCLLLFPPDCSEEKHTHIIFHLSSGDELRFSDTRRFGRFWFFRSGETDQCSGVEKLGMDPFDPLLSSEFLFNSFGKRKKSIKGCLLEQNVVSGIGNIYSDEILFSAGIHPARSADSLNSEEWKNLAAAIPERLTYFIDKNNMTPKEYLKTKGQKYHNTPFLQVYGREGEECLVCGNMLCRIVLGGRSNIYCPVCQKFQSTHSHGV